MLAEPLAVVYKHSPICPTSNMAYEEMRSLRRLQGDVPVYLVDVIHSRPLSRYIAERVGVVHQSPQAIILRAGVPAWHGSHFDLRADEMARTLELLKSQAHTTESLP
jgi:bacillithiol system protein YtxJ